MVESKARTEWLDDAVAEGRSYSGCAACGSNIAPGCVARTENGSEKSHATTGVRFGYMRHIGEFKHLPELRFTCGAKVVVQTQRGIELGTQVSLTCGGCARAVTREQIKAWVDCCGEDTYTFNAGRILREATAADLAEFARIQDSCREKRRFAQVTANRTNLPLKVVECECPLGGERIIFYFTAAERIDFRGMVKELAKEYRTRIEMRQIGARDEARLLADYETCGREVCCKVFLKTLRPISMRMAKVQKATLDPSQVSGRCGRLKCCLRYEHSSYEELDKKLPRMGVRIRTKHGEGVIVNRQVLTQLVQIRTDDETRVSVAAEDITEVNVEAPPKQPTPADKRLSKGATPRPSKKPDRPRRAHLRATERQEKPVEAEPRDSTAPSAASEKQEDGQPTRRRRKRRRRKRRRDGGAEGTGGNDARPPA